MIDKEEKGRYPHSNKQQTRKKKNSLTAIQEEREKRRSS